MTNPVKTTDRDIYRGDSFSYVEEYEDPAGEILDPANWTAKSQHRVKPTSPIVALELVSPTNITIEQADSGTGLKLTVVYTPTLSAPSSIKDQVTWWYDLELTATGGPYSGEVRTIVQGKTVFYVDKTRP